METKKFWRILQKRDSCWGLDCDDDDEEKEEENGDDGDKEEEEEAHIANEFRSSFWEQMMKMTISVTILIQVLRTWKCSVSALHLSRTKLCHASKYLSSAMFLQFVYQGWVAMFIEYSSSSWQF